MKNTMMTMAETLNNMFMNFMGFILCNLDKFILSFIAVVGIYSFCTR